MAQSELKLSLPDHGAAFAPIHYAADKGLFRQRGVDIEVVMLEGGPACASALLSTKVDLTCALGPLIRRAMRDGATGFKGISGLRKTIGFSIVGKPGLTSINDLLGKSIESPSSDWSGGTYFKHVLRELGVEGGIQAKFSYVTQEQRLEGLIKGEFDAGLLSAEKALIAQEHGFKILVAFDKVIPEVCSSVIATTPDLIRERREDLKKIIRAVIKGIQEMQTSREGCVKYLVEKFSMSPGAATSLYNLNCPNWSTDLSVASIQKEIDISHSVHGMQWLPAVDIVDSSLLQEVLNS